MPQIASPQAPTPSRVQAPAWRSSPQADPASSSPFASLLNGTDASQPVPQQQQAQPQQPTQAAAAQQVKPEDKTADAANDNGKDATATPGAADPAPTAVAPILMAAAATAAGTTKTGAAVTDPTADGSTTAAQPEDSADKADKKDAGTADPAANALTSAAAQPTAANPPPAAVVAAIPAAVVVAQQAPAATVAAAAVANGRPPAVQPQAADGNVAPGNMTAAPTEPDAAASDGVVTANPDAGKTGAAPAAPDAPKTQTVATTPDAPKGDDASVVTADPTQETPAQPDANAQAAAPVNANAPALPAAAKVAAAAGKPTDAPRHDVDGTSTLNAGTNALTATGGDGTTTQAAAASAAATASGTGSTTGTAGTTAAPAAPAPIPVAVPLSGVAIEIAGKAQAGKNDFAIRLDPPELGRIEVKLSVDKQGQITSHVIADRSDTLDLLRRDASGLQRSLQDAGLKMNGNGLQFSLRDQSSSGQQNTGGGMRAPQIIVQDNAPVEAARGYVAYSSRAGGLDIRV